MRLNHFGENGGKFGERFLPLFRSNKSIMTASFRIRKGKGNSATIYLRVTADNQRLEKKTRETVNPIFWNGKDSTVKNPNRVSATTDEKERLVELKKTLNGLSTYIADQYRNRKDTEIINGQWLDEVIEAYYNGGRRTELLDNLNNFLNYFIEKILPHKSAENSGKVLSTRTQDKYRKIIEHLKNFQTKENLNLKVSDYDKHISDRFQDYLKNELKHSAVSIGREITIPKAILKDARRMGIQVNELVFTEVKGSKPETPCPILIIDKKRGIDELQQLKDFVTIDPRLKLCRDWMIIGIHTGQRVSDLFSLSTNQITTIEGKQYIVHRQQKTGAKVEIPMHRDVLEILEKRGGNFPEKFLDKPDSNTTIFLKLIKRLCKRAGLDRLEYGKKYDKENKRYIYGHFPLYELFNAHSLRRTFATMYYGKLSTAYIKSVTGHSTEQQLLTYINKKDDPFSSKFYELWEREEENDKAAEDIRKAN